MRLRVRAYSLLCFNLGTSLPQGELNLVSVVTMEDIALLNL